MNFSGPAPEHDAPEHDAPDHSAPDHDAPEDNGEGGAGSASGARIPVRGSGGKGPSGEGKNEDPSDPPDDVGAEVVKAFEQELAAAKRQADEHWEKYLLAQADLENFKRTAEKRRREALFQERRRMLAAFLPVVDNLERALSHADADPADVLSGVEGTYRELQKLLDAEGVAPIQAMEQDFDPELHEAVSVVEMPDLDDERVVAVELPGYTLDGELLRPARVVVGQPHTGSDE